MMLMETNAYSDQPTYEYDTQEHIQPAEAVELNHGNSLLRNQDENENSQKSSTKSSQQLPFSFVRVKYEELQFCECCGQGSFGSVYRAMWQTHGGKEVAVKKLNNMDKEAHILNLLSHRNIVQFYGACIEPPNFCIVTEYAPYGSLFDFLAREESNKLEFNQLLSWARDIALGMNYLHEEAPLTIIHRDLKSKNVVICEDFVLKICDFGASRFFGDTVVMTITGTYPWMAPELIQGLPTSELCDVYSFGVVLWELLTREIPFKGLQGFQVAWAVVERQERPVIPTSCPQRFSDLINRCWSSDVTKRPSFYDIIGEINTMLHNDQLMENTNSFIHSKESWVDEMEEKVKEMKRQEQEFGAKQEELAKKEEKLKTWEERLKNEMKKQTLIGTVKHHKKTENLQFDITGQGKGAINSVKDALNHVMNRSSFGKTEPQPSGFSPFFDSDENESDLQKSSKSTWPLTQKHSPTRNHNDFGSVNFPSKLRPQLSRSSPPVPFQNEEPLINSGIKFEKSEINNNLDIFSKSPFGESGFEHRKCPKFEKIQNKFPGNKVQKQVSSSSEEFSFEGSKMSRSTTETSGGKTKEPEVQTWETAKGDAKMNKSNETFEYVPGQNEDLGAQPPNPPFRKLKSHNSSPNLLSQMTSGKRQNNLFESSSDSGTTSQQVPSENDIKMALRSLMLKPECQALGEDFARNLSEALKEIYSSKQDSTNRPNSQNVSSDELDLQIPTKPRLSLKQSFDDFSAGGNLLNGGVNFSTTSSQSKNISKSSNSSRFERKASGSAFDSSQSNRDFSETNGFSQVSSKNFQKEESSETKCENRKSLSRKMSSSLNNMLDNSPNIEKAETIEESSNSSSKSHRRSSKSSNMISSLPLSLLEFQKEKADWSGMVKPDSIDKSSQTTPQMQQTLLRSRSCAFDKSTQTQLHESNESIKSSNLKPKPKKFLPVTPQVKKQNETVKQASKLTDEKQITYSLEEKENVENFIGNSLAGKDQETSEKAKSNPNSPFFYHGSLRRRRFLPNPYRRFNSDEGDDEKSTSNSTLPHLVATKPTNDNATSQHPHNWTRSMSTPEIRAWKNTLKWLETENLDSFENRKDSSRSPHESKNTDAAAFLQNNTSENLNTAKKENSPKKTHSSFSPAASADSGCCADGRCSRCASPLHGTSTGSKNNAISDNIVRDEITKNSRHNLSVHSTSPLNHRQLVMSNSTDNSAIFPKKTFLRSRLKSDSNLALLPTASLLPAVDNHQSLEETSKSGSSSSKSSVTQTVTRYESKDSLKANLNKNTQAIQNQSSNSKTRVSSRSQQNTSSQKSSKVSTKQLTSSESSNFKNQASSEGREAPSKFSSEIKFLKNKKPRKYVTKQAFNDIDNHIISSESSSALRGLSSSPILDSNKKSDIFETEDFTYIIRPKGRRVRLQGV